MLWIKMEIYVKFSSQACFTGSSHFGNKDSIQMRLQLKPPPSDNLWYGFTFMPDIDFNLESCVRDHKITNACIALFLVNQLKEAFRETLVLPNSECISI
ncbi:hypothetical protein Ahy_A05g023854 isoform B [Arachis hypogaea]|nr:hypothetical protein Ahy_A05g023854 isoform B [Arachis hypogaea]